MLEKMKSIWGSIKADSVDTYRRIKIVLIAIAAILLAIEYKKIKEAILIYMGNRLIKNTKKESYELQTQVNTLNNQANQMVKEAKELPSQEKPVDANWYKGEK